MNSKIDPHQTEEYSNSNVSIIQEHPIADQDKLNIIYQDTEEEEVESTYQRMPQFRLNERRGKFF